jgi:hypothetical protein
LTITEQRRSKKCAFAAACGKFSDRLPPETLFARRGEQFGRASHEF